MRTAFVLRTTASVLVALAWLVLLRGLFLIPVSTDPVMDLEAGHAFAVNFAVYLPGMLLTAVLVFLLPVGVWARWVGSLAALMAAGLVCTFGFWVLTHRALLDYIPGLDAHVWFETALSAAALMVGGMAAAVTSQASRPSGQVGSGGSGGLGAAQPNAPGSGGTSTE